MESQAWLCGAFWHDTISRWWAQAHHPESLSHCQEVTFPQVRLFVLEIFTPVVAARDAPGNDRPRLLSRLRVSGQGRQAKFLKGLILAQNERWRRGLGMQVERIPIV
jgi:hypothetical protein